MWSSPVASLHVLCSRHMVVPPPPHVRVAGFEQGAFLWVAKCQLCGMRDAPCAWQEDLVDILFGQRFADGFAGPTSFHNEKTDAVLGLHVDDFYATGPEDALTGVFGEFTKHLLIKAHTMA